MSTLDGMGAHRPDPMIEALLGVPVPQSDAEREPPMAVRLPRGMRDEVKRRAKERGDTPNGLAVRAIRRELDNPSPKEAQPHGRRT